MKKIWLLCLIGWSLAYAQSNPSGVKALVQTVVPSIVTVRAVVKLDVKAEDKSNTEEVKFTQRGVVLSDDCVIMMSSALLTAESFKQFLDLDAEEADKIDLKVSPQSFKVIFEQESKEYEAELLATESQLGLAFLKVKDLEGRAVRPITIKDSPVEIGTELFCITRMPKGYDFTPYCIRLAVVAEVSKPRKVYMVDTKTDELGLPVFNGQGVVVGVISTIRPAIASDGEEDLGFSHGASECVLPIATVRPVIEQVLQRARAK